MVSRLHTGKSGDVFTSKMSARQFAQTASEKGLKNLSELWEQADRDGWDDLHYRPDPIADQQRNLPPPKKHIADRDRRTFRREDWAELNLWLEQQRATARYRPDGSRYLVDV